ARAARVQARFDVPEGWGATTRAGSDPPDADWVEDGEVILARTVGADGKSSARVGGQLTTASALSDLSARLIEIHGQHGSLRLLDASTQTAFLDRYADAEHTAAVASYVDSYRRATAARRALRRLEDDARDRERELDLLRYQVEEIRSVSPDPGETDALRSEESRLAHGERLLELATAAEEVLVGDGGRLEGLRHEVETVGPAVTALSEQVTGGRVGATAALAEALEGELQDLGMAGAGIQVTLERSPELGPSGAERVELRFRGSPAQQWLSLDKAASGGELSRVMLACRSVLADLDDVPTLIFDEVDAGIGGQAALAVGR